MTEKYEINLANYLVQKFQLIPPVKIEELASKFAKVLIDEIPLDIDGASIGLKRPDALIIVNKKNRSPQRVRFTIAHELGHVLIPNHDGDLIDVNVYEKGEIEGEANRFAAELLAPTSWVKAQIKSLIKESPLEIINAIATRADISRHASLYRFRDCYGPGVIYSFCGPDGEVTESGRSEGTHAAQPSYGAQLTNDFTYPLQVGHWSECQWGGRYLHIWLLGTESKNDEHFNDDDWKKVLDIIVSDCASPNTDPKAFRSSITGAIGWSNGVCKDSLPEELHAVILQRFHAKTKTNLDYIRLLEHPRCNELISKWIRERKRKP